jgi:LmbE family N-acetylglucosaminyl deacetylase
VAEVLPDREVKTALVIMAHPDDAEFWAGGTIAAWSSAGCKVTYLLLTDGDASGFDPTLPRSELPGTTFADLRTLDWVGSLIMCGL